MNAEEKRLAEARERTGHWRRWGPYLSERQWGTVREDYSPDGAAWDYFPHEHARSRAYRWGEDGLLGISDNHQRLCFALALWNEEDSILKERLFGLANSEGNHAEDVKEYYFYLDSTPTHSYMKGLYKYPQAAFPYGRLLQENARRNRYQSEFELLDTGAFDTNRYFDVFAEYAKAATDDLLIRITVVNRGPERARLHLLPTLWFRNTWSWDSGTPRPRLSRVASSEGTRGILAQHPEMRGPYWLACEGTPDLLFTENETNLRRLFGTENSSPFVKDAFHAYLVRGEKTAINPVGEEFERIFAQRMQEADEFYATVIPARLSQDASSVMCQALAGMLWSKQWYHYDVRRWLEGDPTQPPPPPERKRRRSHEWTHLYNDDVISMPDKWEYPWYATWDLAFHCVALAVVDPDFAKDQLILFLREWYMHPNGQIPAYEWALADVNPCVHAWAAWRV